MNWKTIRIIIWREGLVATRTIRSALSGLLTLIMAVGVVYLITSFKDAMSIIPDFGTMYLFIIGLLGPQMILIILIQASSIFSRDYECRIHELLFLSPAAIHDIIIGKVLAAWIQVIFFYTPLVVVLIAALWLYIELPVDVVTIILLIIIQIAALLPTTLAVLLSSLLCRRDMTAVITSLIALYVLLGLGNIELTSYLSPFRFITRLSEAVLANNVGLIDIIAYVIGWLSIILFITTAMIVLVNRRRAYIL